MEGASGRRTMRAPSKTTNKARHLCGNLSVPEARLWNRLRGVRRESRCFAGSIRSDRTFWTAIARRHGSQSRQTASVHDMGDRPQRDLRRDVWLNGRGVTVVRIAANELARDIDNAADAIIRMAAERS